MAKQHSLVVTAESSVPELRAKLVNHVMREGKKAVAREIVTEAFELIDKKHGKGAEDIFRKALDHVCPRLEVKSRRVGGANYQIPIEVNPKRRLFLAMNWILEAARGQKGKPMAIRLANELMAAANGEGGAVKKRDDMHRMADANKAFAHFARF